MATTFAGTATFGLVGSYAKASDLTTIQEAINYTNSPTSYTNGLGAYQANAFFSDTRTLINATDTYDFNTADLFVDCYGANLLFTAVKLLFIKNRSLVSGQRLVIAGDFLGGVATSPLFGSTAPTLSIGPFGSLLLESPIDGFLVTSATSDSMTITNTVTTPGFDYDIIVLGVIP